MIKHIGNPAIWLIQLSLLILAGCSTELNQDSTGEKKNELRIVSLNGTLTEIVSSLGFEAQIAGVDITSTWPETVLEKPNLGHVTRLSAEGVLALNPTHILALEGEISPELQEMLKAGDAQLVFFDRDLSIEGTKLLIKEVAAVFEKNGDDLVTSLQKDLEAVPEATGIPRVLFVYARGAGTLMVAGRETTADAVIKLAGAENAADGFEGFKPLTAEAVLLADPSVVLLFDTGLESIGGIEEVFKIPGLGQTTAAKKQQVIAMDGQYLLGFGPRLGRALTDLVIALNQLES